MSNFAEDKAFIESHEKVSFVPELVPPLRYQYATEEGFYQMLIIINDVKRMLIVGLPNRVERPFYDFYANAYTEYFGGEPIDATPYHDGDDALTGFETWLEEEGEANLASGGEQETGSEEEADNSLRSQEDSKTDNGRRSKKRKGPSAQGR